MYDRAGERKMAVQRYREVVNGTSNPELVHQAEKWLKKPFTGS
jgi:hypothetical protein